MAFSVVEAIDRHVEALEETREPDGAWHPSSLFACPRRALYDFRGVPKSNPPDARVKRVFRIGHMLHEFIQTALAQDPEVDLFLDEVKIVDPERNVKGHADGLVRLRNGRWVVLELKTMNSNGFRYLTGPKPEHVKQASAYADILQRLGGLWQIRSTSHRELAARAGWEIRDRDGKVYAIVPPLGDELTKIRFAYISKDDLLVEEYDTLITGARVGDVDDVLALVTRHQADGTLPKRLPLEPDGKSGKWKLPYQCRYCDWQDYCLKVDQAEGVD